MNQDRPNILVFITDQQRFDALACNGNPHIKTPNIDHLAENGTRFNEAYVCQPICLPQRVSMLTGLYPSSHGSTTNGVPMDKTLPTYPELLRKAGYQTYASGKMHLNPISRGFETPPYEPGEMTGTFPYCGFEKVDFVEGENAGYLEELNEHLDSEYKNPNDLNKYDSEGAFQTISGVISEELHRSTYTADKTINFLEERDRNRPFLVHCSFWDPHHPFDPPKPFDSMYSPEDMPLPIEYDENEFNAMPAHFKIWRDNCWVQGGKSFARHDRHDWQKMKAHYYGMISLIDKQVGRVMDKLKSCGLYENTAIFFVSDHGELLGDHGIALKGPFMYQSLLKIPFIFSYPTAFSPRIINSKVLSYDIMPTILELAKVNIPERITAQSILPLLSGNNQTRKTVLCENTSEGKNARTIVSERYKLSCYLETDEGELFDLENDPDEKQNLWNSDTEIKAELLLELNQLQIKSRRPPPKKIGRW
ncbi:MAG: hypothetical protein A2020_05995 [Lentisphaerae bacterium GWF2_45_14]|nr:MAG: hypothetical protein A2020_05995 [Lentisphaerae bacterium GWF2_45_14]